MLKRRSTGKKENLNNPQTLIAALAGAPEIIIGLVREVPPQHLKRRRCTRIVHWGKLLRPERALVFGGEDVIP